MVSDQSKLVIFNSESGAFISIIMIPVPKVVYNDCEDLDGFWRERTDFAFSEDGIIVFHSRRNSPIAADVLLFW